MARRFSKLIGKAAASPNWSDIWYSILSIVLALAVGAVLIRLSGYSVLNAYANLWFGAFGSSYNLAQTLLKSMPLLFTGLAAAIGLRSGMLNIGTEGQLYWGAFASAVVAISLPHLSGIWLIPLSLLAGAVAGGLWAGIAGYLRAKTGAHEVITTIMLNYVAIFGTTFLVKNYFKDRGPVDQTVFIPEAARLPELIPYTRLTAGILLAVALIAVIDWLYKRTSLGYDLQAVGENSQAAEYAGINASRILVISMVLSGAVAGLAGSTQVMGVLNRFITNFSPGYGFTGIAVAVLGRRKPWGVFLAALLFGALEAGGMSMQLFAKIPSDLMTVVQGLVILLVSAPALIRLLRPRLVKRGEGA